MLSRNRLALHEKLTSICQNVYYQPPESVKLVYPCIIYSLEGMLVRHANDDKYTTDIRYSVMVLDKNPDTDLFDAVHALPKCSFDRSYRSDNINHYVFTLYF